MNSSAQTTLRGSTVLEPIILNELDVPLPPGQPVRAIAATRTATGSMNHFLTRLLNKLFTPYFLD
jgi:hypothetical protein